MRGFRRHTFWRRFPHQFTAGLALLAYWIAAPGLWLPTGYEKDHSQRYPCENNPCGCCSAEECWRHCCCLTAEERWAWAHANGVEPPAYAERPAGHKVHLACCERQDADHFPSILAVGPDAEPCRKPSTCCHAGQSCSTEESQYQARGRVRWVNSMAALQCRGGITLWVSSGAVLPPPPVMTWSPGLLPIDWLSYSDCFNLRISLTPPTPPPRLSYS
jgi:hypothetical protein